MSGWQGPDGVSSVDSLVRTWPSYCRSEDQRCPERVAAKSRVGLEIPGDAAPRKPRDIDSYPLAPAGRILDLVEFHGRTSEEAYRVSHVGAQRDEAAVSALDVWTRHAVEGFLSASAVLTQESGLHLAPASREWVVRDRLVDGVGEILHEQCVTGRRYSADGVREVRILRIGSVCAREIDRREIAAAARVLADGREVLRRSWREAHTLSSRAPDVELVRVVEVGCLDGSQRVVFNGTAEAARAAYRDYAEEPLRAAIRGGEYRPGGHCADCRLVSVCPAVTQAPGLLGADRPTPWRRTWSVTTSREHSACARREYLSSLHLPGRARPETMAVQRGRAVHAWLERSHGDPEAGGCRAIEPPEPTPSWTFAGFELTGEEAALAVQMIGDHAAVCPVDGASPDTRFEPERSVFVFDRAANALVIAKADLLFLRDGAWVLRETKTTSSASVYDPIARYPQTALAIVLAASGGRLDGLAIGCVELELLTGSGPLRIPFDPRDSYTVRHAREVLRRHAGGWLRDTEFKPDPGPGCASCRWTRWCAEAADGTGASPEGEEP